MKYQIEAFKAVLQGGFDVHFYENMVVRDVFELGSPSKKLRLKPADRVSLGSKLGSMQSSCLHAHPQAARKQAHADKEKSVAQSRSHSRDHKIAAMQAGDDE